MIVAPSVPILGQPYGKCCKGDLGRQCQLSPIGQYLDNPIVDVDVLGSPCETMAEDSYVAMLGQPYGRCVKGALKRQCQQRLMGQNLVALWQMCQGSPRETSSCVCASIWIAMLREAQGDNVGRAYVPVFGQPCGKCAKEALGNSGSLCGNVRIGLYQMCQLSPRETIAMDPVGQCQGSPIGVIESLLLIC